MNKQLWKLSTKTPFGFDHYELVLDSNTFGATSGSVNYGQTTVNIDRIESGQHFIKAKFFTDIPISEEIEINMSGLDDQMFGFVKIGPHTKVEAFATRATK